MSSAGAPPEAIDFFSRTGYWLRAFSELGKMDAALVQPPALDKPAPQLAFLGPGRAAQIQRDLFDGAFPKASTDHAQPFRDDPKYAALLDAAKKRFQGGDDPLDLRLFDIVQLESSAALSSGGQQFIVQIGVHNFCQSCGVGVAARYSFDFDPDGKPTGVKLLGLCQGRVVTADVEGYGKATYHEFAGLAVGKDGVREPYLLTVPGLTTCPEHVKF